VVEIPAGVGCAGPRKLSRSMDDASDGGAEEVEE